MMQSKVRRDAYVAAHISNTVASQILMLREAKGWTQKQLAEKCGMRQSRISALEDPNYENFEAATLRRIASAYDVALTIRFIPFSELTGWTARLSSAELLPPVDFTHDSLPSEKASDNDRNAAVRNLLWSTTRQTAFNLIAATSNAKRGSSWTVITVKHDPGKSISVNTEDVMPATAEVIASNDAPPSYEVTRQVWNRQSEAA